MLVEEIVDYVLTVIEAYSSFEVLAPTLSTWLWIRPQDIRDDPATARFHWPLDVVDAGDVLDEWTESSVHAKDAVWHNGGNRVEIEAVWYDFPCFNVEPSLALVVEAIELIELAGLVVAPEEEEVVGAFDFVGH